MSEFVIRGFVLSRIHPHQEWCVGLEGVDFTPSADDDEHVVIPKAFVLPDDAEDGWVSVWTESSLRRMDKLGIMFPASVSLYGPVMLPSVADVSELVPVWYSTGFDWQTDFVITDAVVRLVDELMAGVLPDDALSFEDKRFLAWHHPDAQGVLGVFEGLQEGAGDVLYA